MLKKLAWDAFKNTGDVNTYIELSKVIDVEKQLELEQKEYVNYQNEGDSTIRELGGRL